MHQHSSLPEVPEVCFDIGGLFVQWGNGDGTFAAPRRYGPPALLVDFDVADIDGDGAPELVMAGQGLLELLELPPEFPPFDFPLLAFPHGTVGVVEFNGRNGAVDTHEIRLRGSQPGMRLLGLADFDEDGVLDFLVATAEPELIAVHFGNGDGTADPVPLEVAVPAGVTLEFGTSYWRTAVPADLNGDGSLDIVASAIVDGSDPESEVLLTIPSLPPDTALVTGPADGSVVGPAGATFTYSGSPASMVRGFECAVDGGDFTGCPTTGSTIAGLTDGEHTFAVRAVGPRSTVDPTPAEVTFVVDATGPTTTIGLTPAAPDGANSWYRSSVGVVVSGDDGALGSGVAASRCVVDPPSVPATYAALPAGGCGPISTDGTHTVHAASIDVAGNPGPVVSRTLRRDASGPTITVATPAEGAAYGVRARATAAYACSDAVSGLATCVGTVANGSPVDTSTSGMRTFTVVATDRAGNTTTVVRTYQVCTVLVLLYCIPLQDPGPPPPPPVPPGRPRR